jgi:hypothetical protein
MAAAVIEDQELEINWKEQLSNFLLVVNAQM